MSNGKRPQAPLCLGDEGARQIRYTQSVISCNSRRTGYTDFAGIFENTTRLFRKSAATIRLRSPATAMLSEIKATVYCDRDPETPLKYTCWAAAPPQNVTVLTDAVVRLKNTPRKSHCADAGQRGKLIDSKPWSGRAPATVGVCSCDRAGPMQKVDRTE